MRALRSIASAIKLCADLPATGLLRGEDGRVAGVRATGPDRRGLELRARATLMACGGYQGNAEMIVALFFVPATRPPRRSPGLAPWPSDMRKVS